MKKKNIITLLGFAVIISGIFIIGVNKAAAPEQPGLPEAVKETREQIYKAVQTQDYAKVASVASDPFLFSFGAPDYGFEEHLRQYEGSDFDVFEKIQTLLEQPYSYEEVSGIYAWPGVFLKESSEWTAEDVAMLQNIASEEEIEAYRSFGGYYGYRIGIKENGEWIYFIAGD